MMNTKKERFRSKMELIYVPVAGIAGFIYLGYLQNGPYAFDQNTIEGISFAAILLAMVVDWKVRTYLEIQDNRWLVNSGYYTFWKQKFDIFDIKYIYRYPNLRLKWYGSRMVFYIKTPDGKLRQSSLREVNFSNDTLRAFLKRIKQIKPAIELDPEYEKFLEDKLDLENASENTVASVEARLKEKGDVWK
jgi:hypothetical protein